MWVEPLTLSLTRRMGGTRLLAIAIMLFLLNLRRTTERAGRTLHLRKCKPISRLSLTPIVKNLYGLTTR